MTWTLDDGGSVHYYDDAANSRFIVQWTDVPHYGTTTPGLYTFQVILNASGSVLCQYLDMRQTLNSSTIGMENADGSDGLQVVFNANYIHNDYGDPLQPRHLLAHGKSNERVPRTGRQRKDRRHVQHHRTAGRLLSRKPAVRQ